MLNIVYKERIYVFSNTILHQRKLIFTVQYCQEKEIKAILIADREVDSICLDTPLSM